MRALGTGETSSLVIKNFDKALHIKLRTASVKHSTSVKAIVTKACYDWLKETNREAREAKKAQKTREALKKATNMNPGSNPGSPPKIDGAVA